MKRLFWTIVASTAILISCTASTDAFEKREHDEYLEQVLFGEKNLSKEDDRGKAIKVLESASYLCIDQFNGNGERELKCLKDYGVAKLPKNVKDGKEREGINFSANSKHRKYTHKGWDYDYSKGGEDKANWLKRKEILQMTVKKICDSDNLFISVVENVKSIFSGNLSNEQYDSFCALVYYVHILGDQISSDKYDEEFNEVPLIRINGKGEYNIIQELQKHFEILFASQKNKASYLGLMRDMEELKIEAERYYNRSGSFHNPDNFELYRQCEEKLMEVLGKNIPQLLENEDFFIRGFC